MTDARLSITRDFAHPPERVWHAWTNPSFLVKWLGPVDWPAVKVEADVRVGGQWRACLLGQGSEELWQSGRYLVLDAPNRLEMTFKWDGDNHVDGPGVETHVTVILEATAHGTRMLFTQTGLATAASAEGHTHGWSSCFDRLEQFLR